MAAAWLQLALVAALCLATGAQELPSNVQTQLTMLEVRSTVRVDSPSVSSAMPA